MKLFLLKCLVFLLPVVVLFLLPGYVLFLGREYYSNDHIIRIQNENNSLFGFAYNSKSFFDYKLNLIKYFNPKVIALGSSQVMQFREEFFSVSFINAGGAGKTMNEIKIFFEHMPKENIEIIILGLDDFILYDKPRRIEIDNSSEITSFISSSIFMSRRIYLDIINKKVSLSKLYTMSKESKNIGISAIINGDGFRKDGSYKYSRALANKNRVNDIAYEASKKNFQLKKISKNPESYFETNLESLDFILKESKSKNIVVIGFLPPVYPELYYEDSDSFITKRSLLKNLFNKHGMVFFDASNIKNINGTSSNFVDLFHASDKLYLEILKSLSKESPQLLKFVDSVRLQKTLFQNTEDFLEF